MGRCPPARGPRTAPAPRTPTSTSRSSPTRTSSAQGRALAAADRRLLDAVAGQALLALRNQQVARRGRRGAAPRRRHRAAHRAAVRGRPRPAHPADSIKAAAGSLRDPNLRLSDADRGELAATVEESADRLTGVVDNLLDSSRIATGAVDPELQPVGYDEVAPLALRGLDGTDRRPLDLDDRLPEVLADPGLLERVVANLVDNALRHGRGSPVTAARQRPRRPRRAARRRRRPRRPREASPTACSPRSSGSATASRGGLGLGLASPAASPRPWAARSPPTTPPAAG